MFFDRIILIADSDHCVLCDCCLKVKGLDIHFDNELQDGAASACSDAESDMETSNISKEMLTGGWLLQHHMRQVMRCNDEWNTRNILAESHGMKVKRCCSYIKYHNSVLQVEEISRAGLPDALPRHIPTPG